ncbi:hypothetical protein BGZ76_000270 [Entomortierella beljakovae]|nr:hypothetical protein BGZ76_000270 [Entomortierella beljakovae]
MLFKPLFVIALVASVVNAIIINPHINYPRGGEVFKAGDKITVRWDGSAAKGYPNRGMILLGHPNSEGEGLDVEHPLAEGFPLTVGKYSITIPHVRFNGSYIICLLGDSGNISKTFKIVDE